MLLPDRTHGCKECEDKINEHNKTVNWNETFRLSEIENRRLEEDRLFKYEQERAETIRVDEYWSAIEEADRLEGEAVAQLYKAESRLTQAELKEKEVELRHDLLRQHASRIVDITKAAAARASMPPPATTPAKKAKAAPPVAPKRYRIFEMHPTHLVVPLFKAAPSHDQVRNSNNNMDNDPLFEATVLGGHAPPAKYAQVMLKAPPVVKASPAITGSLQDWPALPKHGRLPQPGELLRPRCLR